MDEHQEWASLLSSPSVASKPPAPPQPPTKEHGNSSALLILLLLLLYQGPLPSIPIHFWISFEVSSVSCEKDKYWESKVKIPVPSLEHAISLLDFLQRQLTLVDWCNVQY